MTTQLEQEEQAIEDAYGRGEITAKQMREELRDLYRDYQGAAEEAAEQAYRDTMNDWGFGH